MAKNESKNPAKEYSVGGYTFKTKEGAQAAKDELAAIKYMSSKTDSTNAKQVYILYHDIIDKKLFNTLIGMNYLKELQQFLYLSPDVPNEKIRPIPINNETKEMISFLCQLTDFAFMFRKFSAALHHFFCFLLSHTFVHSHVFPLPIYIYRFSLKVYNKKIELIIF